MTRAEILKIAEKQVTGQRVQDYGKPEDNFSKIAGLWSAYIGHYVSELDVAMMMGLMKIARIKTGDGGTDDCFVDLAGYAACGGEIVGNEKDEKSKQDRAFRLWRRGFGAEEIEEEVGIDISKAKEYVEYFERHFKRPKSKCEKHAAESASTNKADECKDDKEDYGLFAMIRDYYDQNPNKCYKEIADELAIDIFTVEGALKNYPKKGIDAAVSAAKFGTATAAEVLSGYAFTKSIVPAPPDDPRPVITCQGDKGVLNCFNKDTLNYIY